jgi:hypothetical protein
MLLAALGFGVSKNAVRESIVLGIACNFLQAFSAAEKR